MASAEDRRAALLLLALAGLGAAARLLIGGGGAPGSIGFRPAHERRPVRDTVVVAAARMARPLGAGETVDVDRATAAELSRLPRIGAGLAARIVRDRETRGAFGSLDGLGRVPGVGPTVLDAIRTHATFSGRPRPAQVRPAQPARIAVNRATAEELTSLPGIGPHLAAAIVTDRARHGPYRTAEDLLRVRGIGPVMLERLKGRILVP
jgi:competence ComEA-like helix-hairpin-helix protein